MELIILLAVILLFFGARRIPDLVRSLGKGTREFRKGISEGATEDEAQEDREKNVAKPPSLDGVAHDESPHAEAEAAHAGQKS